MIRSRDIVFMEEKTIVDWESEMKRTSSELTDRDQLEETRVYTDESRISIEDQYEPTGFRQETEATGRGQNAETGQDPESDSDEEPTEEPVAENQGRRYPLRERRAPRRFPDEEHVLLTDEGDPKSFQEAKEDTHNRKWLSAMQDEMDSLHENHTYELMELPKGKRTLRNKWV